MIFLVKNELQGLIMLYAPIVLNSKMIQTLLVISIAIVPLDSQSNTQ